MGERPEREQERFTEGDSGREIRKRTERFTKEGKEGEREIKKRTRKIYKGRQSVRERSER